MATRKNNNRFVETKILNQGGKIKIKYNQLQEILRER